MLDKVRTFVTQSYGRENLHLERTLYWVRVLEPEAGEELLIAALSHDIERAFSQESKDATRFNTGEEMEVHQAGGARIMFDFLMAEGYDRQKAQRVSELIAKHEVGGDREQDILMDADSLSWLEVSAPKHIRKGIFSAGELRKKIGDMYGRISSERAKALAEPFYESAVADLKLLENK